jgi:hypothetical protein
MHVRLVINTASSLSDRPTQARFTAAASLSSSHLQHTLDNTYILSGRVLRCCMSSCLDLAVIVGINTGSVAQVHDHGFIVFPFRPIHHMTF